jgi:hypothetical protein
MYGNTRGHYNVSLPLAFSSRTGLIVRTLEQPHNSRGQEIANQMPEAKTQAEH